MGKGPTPIGVAPIPYTIQLLLVDEEVRVFVYKPYASVMLIKFLLISQFVIVCFAQGAKIEASIRKSLVQKFKKQFEEDKIYKIVYFSVASNDGKYKASTYEHQRMTE